MDCLINLHTVPVSIDDPNAAPGGVHYLFKRGRFECLPSVGDIIAYVDNQMHEARVTRLRFIAYKAREQDLLSPGMVEIDAEAEEAMTAETLADAIQNHGWSDKPPEAGAPAFYSF